jgi:hypothetical protein
MQLTTVIACAAVGMLAGMVAFCFDDIKQDYQKSRASAAWFKDYQAEQKERMDRLTFKTFDSKVELCAAKLSIGLRC